MDEDDDGDDDDDKLCTDIDECAAGGKAEKCRYNGGCNGLQPPGSYTCTCHTGYTFDRAMITCKGMIVCKTTLIISGILQYI